MKKQAHSYYVVVITLSNGEKLNIPTHKQQVADIYKRRAKELLTNCVYATVVKSVA